MNRFPFDDEQAIMEKFRQGDESAVRYIFLNYSGVIYNFAYNIVRDKDDANDITAKAFTALWLKRERFETLSKLKSFLFTVARNACIDIIKLRKREQQGKQDYQRYEMITEENIYNAAIESELYRILTEIIDRLPPQCRKIFKLIFYEHYSSKQVAEHLGIEEKTVRNQKVRAIVLIRIELIRRKFLP